jgi:acyl dehydratase
MHHRMTPEDTKRLAEASGDFQNLHYDLRTAAEAILRDLDSVENTLTRSRDTAHEMLEFANKLDLEAAASRHRRIKEGMAAAGWALMTALTR